VVLVVVVVVAVAVVVVITMVVVIPVAFMHLPALLVVVVVRMAPIGAGVRWPLPHAGGPDIAAAALSPIAIDPDEAFSRHRRSYLIPDRWRRSADINLDLAECRDC
jgi:hypothetical protein